MKHDEFIDVINTLLEFNKECYRWDEFGISLWDLRVWDITMNFVDTYLRHNLTEDQIDTFWDNYDVLTPEELWTLLTNQSSNE
jgi:hypothetical protein